MINLTSKRIPIVTQTPFGSACEGHAALITNLRRFKDQESPTSIPPESPSTPEIGREERIKEAASRGFGTVEDLERDRNKNG